MKLKPLILALIMALTALASISVQATGPDCDPQVQDPLNPVTVLEEDGVACALVNGPGVVSIQGGPSLGMNQIKDPGWGAAFFDVTNWNDEEGGDGDASHDVHVWVEYVGAACGVAGFFCGFDIELCQDTDDDGNCGGDDSTHTAYAHDGTNVHPLGTNPDCQKDTKGAPCTGTTAELTGCIDQDVIDGNGDGDWDDIVVFISTWIGVSDTTLEVGEQGDFISAGIALGLFDVTVEDLGGNDETCFPDVKIVVDEPLNCEGDWQNFNDTTFLGGAQCYTVGDIDTVACQTTVVDSASGTRTVTMECFTPNGCEETPINVNAAVSDPIDGAISETTIWCDEGKNGNEDPGEFVLTASAGPGTDVDVQQGTKTFGDYYCIMAVSGPAAGAWAAGGFCRGLGFSATSDSTAKPYDTATGQNLGPMSVQSGRMVHVKAVVGGLTLVFKDGTGNIIGMGEVAQGEGGKDGKNVPIPTGATQMVLRKPATQPGESQGMFQRK